jgi:hypothetical protein
MSGQRIAYDGGVNTVLRLREVLMLAVDETPAMMIVPFAWCIVRDARLPSWLLG